MRKLWLLLIPVAALIAYAALRRSAPPAVPFTKTARETVISTLTTNGKVEPVEYSAVRAGAAGSVARILVERGQQVQQGQVLVEMNAAVSRAALSGAEARVAQSQAELQSIAQGGNARELSQIDSAVAADQTQLTIAKNELAATERLYAKKAATKTELDAARQAVEKIQLDMDALQRRRAALVTAADRAAAQARLREAESGAESARVAVSNAVVRSPMTGTLYNFDVKPGAYLSAGDLVGTVGKLDQLRVTVYVDEPELGRVAKGMPVTITWDAMPGRQWTGKVERTPTQIVTLGTRQVGEVTCIIDNPDRTLIPGTNVNAEIRSAVVHNALTIPKEALRRQGDQSGVFKLEGDRIKWQPVRLGVSSVTRIQVLSGLGEGDSVALPIETPLRDGEQVQPTSESL